MQIEPCDTLEFGISYRAGWNLEIRRNKTVIGVYRKKSVFFMNQNRYSILEKFQPFKEFKSFIITNKTGKEILIEGIGKLNASSSVVFAKIHYEKKTLRVERRPNSIFENHKGRIQIFQDNVLLIQLTEEKRNFIFSAFRDEGRIKIYVADKNQVELIDTIIISALLCKDSLRPASTLS